MRRTQRVVVAVAVLGTAAWWILADHGDRRASLEDVVGEATRPAPGTELDAADGELSARGASAGAADDGAILAEGRVDVRSAWRVRVVAEDDGSPVAGARVDADLRVGPPRVGVLVGRRATTSADGVALLRRMPVAKSARVHASAEGFLLRTIEAPASDDVEREFELRLERALPDAESVARIVADVAPGADAPGADGVRFVVEHGASGRRETVASGGTWWVSNRRGDPPTQRVSIRALADGWMGPVEEVDLVRGTTTRVAVAPPAARRLRVHVRGPDGAPVEGAAVEAAAGEIAMRDRRDASARAVSAEDGVAELRVREGVRASVRVVHPTRVDPALVHAVDVRGADVELEVVLLPLPLVEVELDGASDVPDGTSATLRWSSAEAATAADEAAALARVGRREPVAPVRAAAPPDRATVSVEGDGRRTLRVRVRPGAWGLEVSVGGRASLPTTFVVPPEGTRVLVGLAPTLVWAVRLTEERSGVTRPLVGALVVARPAGFEARQQVERVCAAMPRPADGDGADRWARAVEGALRATSGVVGPDVGGTDRGGVARPRVHAPPDALTVIGPDGRVAVVLGPWPAAVDGAVPVALKAASWEGVRVEVRARDGQPAVGVQVVVNALSDVAAGRLELAHARSTDADGALWVGALPGEAFALVAADGRVEDGVAEGYALATPRASPGGTFRYVEVRRTGDGPARVTLRPSR